LLEIYTTRDAAVRAEYGLEYAWDLQATPMLCRLYFNFSHAGTRFPGPEGTAPRDDPGPLHPRDHHVAWVAFMKSYRRERAARGFFLERASPGHMRYSISRIPESWGTSSRSNLATVRRQMLGG
jgi:hypothetical protein